MVKRFVSVVVEKYDLVLLVKKKFNYDGSFNGLWDFLKGPVENGENIVEAAIKNVKNLVGWMNLLGQ